MVAAVIIMATALVALAATYVSFNAEKETLEKDNVMLQQQNSELEGEVARRYHFIRAWQERFHRWVLH